jgi:hypothetical protein
VEPETVQKTEQPAATVARQSGSIRYEVYYGSDRFSVGRSVQTWSIEENSYRLTSFSETTGLVGLFKPYQYGYVAEGRVEPDGLRPESFSVSRGREGERQASARFDFKDRLRCSGEVLCPGPQCSHIVAVAHEKLAAAVLLIKLDAMGFAVSAGSACSSGTLKRSRALAAFGIDDELAGRTIRVSIGWNTALSDLEAFCDAWREVAKA